MAAATASRGAVDGQAPQAQAGEAWRAMLEDACKEALREIALSAAQPEAAGSGTSVDSIVRKVAARAMEGAASRGLVMGPRSPDRSEPLAPEPEPLLKDIRAIPWALWRESREGSLFSPKGMPCRDRDDSTPLGACCSLEMVGQDDAASNRDLASTRAGTRSDASDLTEEDAVPSSAIWEAEDKSTACLDDEELSCSLGHTPPTSPDMRAVTRGSLTVLTRRDSQGCGRGEGDDGVTSDTLVAGRAGGALPSALVGERLAMVRNGLTMATRGADPLVMQWRGRPRTVLLVAKRDDHLVRETLQDMAAWLSSQGIVVVLEPLALAQLSHLKGVVGELRTFSSADRLERSVDLVITIGGDGTLTWAVSLFKGAMPPVLSFAAGSLGFLTPFGLEKWVHTLTRLLVESASQPPSLVCRMRLRVTVHRRGHDGCFEGQLEVQCLNEVLVHRGDSGSLAKLDVSVNGERITLVQGDGLILATPTGSTAYSLAAGGSMVHPGVPAILLTPVSPHSLSFRPALLPESSSIALSVPLTARCGAALSVDGKDICQLHVGDSVEVSCSPHPVPTICHTSETSDWFASVNQALQWNGRAEHRC